MKKTIFSTLLLLAFLLSGCSSGAPSPSAPVDAGPTVDPNLVFTSGAQTVVAQITIDAANRPVPTAALPESATIEPLPTLETVGTPAELSALPTLEPLAGTTPGAIVAAPTLAGGITTLAAPAATAAPLVTPVQALPDRMQWVSNTPPDGSKVPAGKKFKITWKVTNIGTTTWTSTYSIKHFAGTQLAVNAGYPIDKDVAPNKNTDLTVDAVAPTTPGEYYSLWVLQNPEGVNFGKFDITLTVQ